jgi:hypothetical protein
MSLRIIVKTAQIRGWIEERHGTPVCRRNTDDDLAVLFDGEKSAFANAGTVEYDTLSVDELVEAMKLNHLVLLVDQEAGKTFHKFIQHG